MQRITELLPARKPTQNFRLITILTMSVLAVHLLTAQNKSLRFETGSWADIKTLAAREKKIIFLDAYASWCQPCKWMDNNVFTNDSVADYFNVNFINAKIDMESGEGPELAREYHVTAYPTLLFIDGNGTVVSKVLGAYNASQLLQIARDANKTGPSPGETAPANEMKYENASLSGPNKTEIGFNISQYHRDFGIGLRFKSPYFLFKAVAVSGGANIQWLEHLNGTEITWTLYQNVHLGVRGRQVMITDNISVYGEGGMFGILPNKTFSTESFVMGGYGLFGFGFRVLPGFAYFIELGGVGSGATADKVVTKPIYSNGFLINVGLAIGL